jgi:hypothetical protein
MMYHDAVAGPDPILERLEEGTLHAIAGILSALGHAPCREGRRVRLGIGCLAASCHVPEYEAHPDACMAIVGVETLLEADQASGIMVYQMGTGRSLDEAVHDAVRQWLQGVLPAISGATQGGRAEDTPDPSGGEGPGLPACETVEMATLDRGSGRVESWTVFQGELLLVGQNGDAIRVRLQETPVFAMLMPAYLTTESEGRAGEGPLRWIKAFLCRGADGEIFGECLLNNRDWPDGLAALQRFSWPDLAGLMGFKQFLVLRRVQIEDLG